MTDAMAHRGPDADACWAEGNVALGHRRLSIIDLSTAANQPFIDNSGRYVVVFNGEIYNYRDVQRQIHGYDFRTTSDTEVLIAAYIRWGPACVEYLRGMFAFVIWDRQERVIFMARDPLGVKPLYYSWKEDTLVFASEIRALLASGRVERKIDETALLDYFSYQSVGGNQAIIRDVHQLQAGSWMRITPGGGRHGGTGRIGTEQKKYWDLTMARGNFDFSDLCVVQKRIGELLLQSIERRLVSDVPVGAFLSGGIDSSAVVGLMAQAGKDKPNTFNISFEEKEYDESAYADLVAKKFHTNHVRILLRPTVFLEELTGALDAMDTPSGDGINSYVVSKAIRSHGMTVALSGVGGDELFAGYPFFDQYLKLRKMDWLPRLPGGLRKGLASLLSPRDSDGRRGRMAQLLRLDGYAIENTYPIFRQILSPAAIEQLTALHPNGSLLTSVQQELIAGRIAVQQQPLLSQVSIAEYLGYTQHTLLKDTDQMGMAASLEVREPFFDQDLVEYVLAVPDKWKTPTYPKSLLVESLKPLLPDEIVFRKKQGFLFPWKVWLRNDLKTFCAEHLESMAGRSFIRGDGLMDRWNRFLAGDDSVRWPEIWLFVVLDYWLQKNEIG